MLRESTFVYFDSQHKKLVRKEINGEQKSIDYFPEGKRKFEVHDHGKILLIALKDGSA